MWNQMLFPPVVLLANGRMVLPLSWVTCRDTTKPAAPQVSTGYPRLKSVEGTRQPSCQSAPVADEKKKKGRPCRYGSGTDTLQRITHGRFQPLDQST